MTLNRFTRHHYWACLPNAKVIDDILLALRDHAPVWARVWSTVRKKTWHDARYRSLTLAYADALSLDRKAEWNATCDEAWDIAHEVAWNAEWNDILNNARDDARSAVCNVLGALVAYDDCASVLTSKPEEIEVLAILGDDISILMYPAVAVMHEVLRG